MSFMRLVYDYQCYRTFLKDFYSLQKQKNASFSYKVFSKQLGLSSAAHIQLILSGKRNVTIHNIHRMAEELALPPAELEYFEALVHENQAETTTEKKYYKQRLRVLHSDKPNSSARLKLSFLLSSGILPALLLSVEGKTLEEAISAGDRFGYSREESAQVLKQLLTEGVIYEENSGSSAGAGRLRLSQRHLILHDKKARSQAQKRFLSEQLRLSTRAFETMYEKNAKFFSHTFTIRPESLEQYISEIKGVIERLTRLSDEESGDTVMQFNVQLFPYEKSLNKH